MRFWLGGYGEDDGGTARGIGALTAGEPDAPSAGGALSFAGDAVAAPSPSWIARHPVLPVVYGALEGRGAVASFGRRGDAALRRVGDVVDAGDAVCHVAVAPHGRSLVASCWGDGRVVRVALDGAGRLGRPVVAPAAVDPYGIGVPVEAPDARAREEAERAAADADEEQAEATHERAAVAAVEPLDLEAAARSLREAVGDAYAHLVPDYDADARAAEELRRLLGDADAVDLMREGEYRPGAEESAPAPATPRASRAHAALFLPDGTVATTDLGFDLVRFWRETGSGLRPVQQVALPLGSGPRHLVHHPSGHLYVLSEHSCELFVLARGRDGRWRHIGGVALSPFATSGDGGDAGAEVTLAHDAEFVYAGLRGSDTIAVARVRGEGETLAPVALAEAGVAWPRHHLVVRDTLLVAGQRSNEVVSLTLDIRTGVPGRVRHRTEAPTPTCIARA